MQFFYSIADVFGSKNVLKKSNLKKLNSPLDYYFPIKAATEKGGFYSISSLREHSTNDRILVSNIIPVNVGKEPII